MASRLILATGYSRELEGNTHAEANALAKARSLTPTQLAQILSLDPNTNTQSIPTIDALLAQSHVYTTLEPCSVRLSGLAPCADALIDAKIAKCIIGVGEPTDFVRCEGADKLSTAGVEVIWLKGLERECLDVARTGHTDDQK